MRLASQGWRMSLAYDGRREAFLFRQLSTKFLASSE